MLERSRISTVRCLRAKSVPDEYLARAAGGDSSADKTSDEIVACACRLGKGHDVTRRLRLR